MPIQDMRIFCKRYGVRMRNHPLYAFRIYHKTDIEKFRKARKLRSKAA